MQRRVALLTLLAAGCSSEVAGPPEPPELEAERSAVPVPEAEPVPALPEVNPETGLMRVRRRMDVDQLDASLRRFSGGIGWMAGNRNRLQELAPTLGRPDYIQIVDEDLTPSAMFQKFLDDAARAVCDELMVVDPQREPAERAFFVEAEPSDGPVSAPAATKANLQHLLLRAHGVEAGEAELAPWLGLMESIQASDAGGVEAWNTVCVGLLIHPDFFTY